MLHQSNISEPRHNGHAHDYDHWTKVRAGFSVQALWPALRRLAASLRADDRGSLVGLAAGEEEKIAGPRAVQRDVHRCDLPGCLRRWRQQPQRRWWRRHSGWQLRDHGHGHVGIDTAFHNSDTHGTVAERIVSGWAAPSCS